VRLGELLAHRHQLHRGDLQPAVFEARKDAPSKKALNAVWLDQNEGAL
jgi:hypothetical protein